ncbi:hypothetical protein Mapa_001015 [Marchantia paleacea]|nr:hypothetical protein Mapa_001015 [Marchantia paleacea]
MKGNKAFVDDTRRKSSSPTSFSFLERDGNKRDLVAATSSDRLQSWSSYRRSLTNFSCSRHAESASVLV